MKLEKFLAQLTEIPGVSGYEGRMGDLIGQAFSPYVDEIRKDNLQNLIALKKGEGENCPSIMLAAHMDEIGLMVAKIEEKGFLRITSIGGVDERTILAQEVTVHGKKPLYGIVGAKPPHLQEPDERKKAVKMEDLYVDCGLPEEKIRELVRVGDPITVNREYTSLHNKRAAAKALDDRAGVAVILEVFKELQYLKHTVDVYGVATVQEEVGTRGAFTSTYGIMPDLGIAIDVGFGHMPGILNKEDTINLGKGAAIGIGPHVHPKIFKKLKELADELKISYQLEPSPYPGGTDAYAIQITRSGVPTGLISIPLRYMHTSVETLDLEDIRTAARLLAQFIARIDHEFVEGLKCF
ncbi:aminopeptidase [Anoxybacter fermentans]|uniref:Aminopeptidase n=1 Tax=Anoxybacter fermentans TaxID=1323375 RepID=A0A3Q9HRD2_9FIRM|nr:M42 family metallopeptidase [Anoxybacter fermentans]AZR72834.1 aminopeptidase [Anoxybacter fermentans]